MAGGVEAVHSAAAPPGNPHDSSAPLRRWRVGAGPPLQHLSGNIKSFGHKGLYQKHAQTESDGLTELVLHAILTSKFAKGTRPR